MGELEISTPFSIRDAKAAGFSRGDLRSMLTRGEIREAVRGAYVSVDVPDSTTLRASALSRVVPLRAVVCRRTAAWLHGVDAMALGAHLVMPPTEVLVPAETAATRRGGVIGYSGKLRDDEVVEIDGVLCTSPVRTALDLGRWLPLIDGVAAVDAMLHADVVHLDELGDGLVRLRGYRNKLRLERVLDLADARSESPQESRLRIRLVVYAKLPCPEVQFVVSVADRTFRLDLAYIEVRIAVEYDGDEHHTAASDIAHDAGRRGILNQLGWTVHVARSADVLTDWPAFVAQVRASLRVAGWRAAS